MTRIQFQAFQGISHGYTARGTAIRFGNDTKSPQALARYIDHTKLTYKDGENPQEAIRQICKEARENNFYAVCVRPDMVKLSRNELKGSGVKVATVIGFPQGKTALLEAKTNVTTGSASLPEKVKETREAIANGAEEIDLVLNVGQFLRECIKPTQTRTLNELKTIKAASGSSPLKVILETDLLTPAQVELATKLCIRAGADMVKTSTGMIDGGKGATVETIALMKKTLETAGVYGKMGIKASGGIKTAETAQALIDAGATRLGTSSGTAIVSGSSGQSSY